MPLDTSLRLAPTRLLAYAAAALLCAMFGSFLLTLNADAVAGDGASSAIVLLDSDANGKLDRITFSIANPNGETWALQGASPYGLSVTQAGADITITTVAITSLATANPVLIQVDLNQADTDLQVDTNGVSSAAMELIYSQVTWATCNAGLTPSICDAIDEELNAIATGDGAGAVNTEADSAKPIILAAATGDANANGTVDRLALTFSESVVVTDGGTDNDITLVASTGTATIDAGVYGVTATTLTYVVSPSATGNTAITLTPTYATAGAGDITDANGNEMLNGETVAGTDAAKPVTMTAVSADNNSDGTTDRLTITFSESVTVTDGGTDDDFTLTASTGTATITAGTYGVTATSVTYVVLPTATGNTAITLRPTYVAAGAGSVIDANANEMNNGDTVTGTDGAKPAILTAATGDANANGTVDRLVLTFSESVVVTDGGTDDDVTLVASSGTATIDTGVYGVTATTLTYVVTPSVTGDTSITLTPTYVAAGAGDITDANGNEMLNGETVAGTDAAKPVTMTAVSADSNSDGTVDRLAITFSEAVTVTDGGTDDDFTLTASTGTATIVAGTYGVTATSVTYVVLPSATGNTAITLRPTYVAAGAGSVIDASANEMNNGDTVAGTDGAKPAFLTATTADNNSDGTVDRLTVTFSENVDVTDGGTDNDVTLVASTGTATITAAVYTDPGTNTLTYTISVSATGNTAITVTPTYATAGAGDITDANTNEMLNGETVAGTDAAKPAILTAATNDNGANGSVDRLVLTFSESVTVTDGGTDNDFTLVASSGTATITAGTYGTTASTLTYVIVPTAGSNTGITVAPTYATAGAGSVIDANANEMLNGETVTGTDAAAPVVVSVSPADAAINVSRGTSLVITFSETMNTTFAEATQFAISPNPSGTQTAVWTSTDTVATIALPTLGCSTAYTVTTAEGTIADMATVPVALVTTGPSDGDWGFSTAGCGSTAGGGGSSVITTSMLVNSPNGGQSYTAGNIATIGWTGSNVSTVTLSYATSSTGTYTVIASGLNGTGSYEWTVPNVSTTTAYIKAAGFDGTTALSSDTSDTAFTIVGTVVVPPATDAVAPQDQPSTGMGVSPYTGLAEVINVVSVGDVLRGEHYSTVYYIDGNMKRRPFFDAQTYFTYYSNWSNVRVVTDATLSTLTIGNPMLPKANVVLVKIVSDPRVYALEVGTDGVHETNLRWIPSESVAVTLYGANWADYVIDIPSTLYTRFGQGADMTTGDSVDRGGMRTRATLNQ